MPPKNYYKIKTVGNDQFRHDTFSPLVYFEGKHFDVGRVTIFFLTQASELMLSQQAKVTENGSVTEYVRRVWLPYSCMRSKACLNLLYPSSAKKQQKQ